MPAKTKPATVRARLSIDPQSDRTAPDLDITRARVLDRALNALRPHATPEVIDYHRDQARELRVTALPHEAEMLRVADEHEAIAEILDVLRSRGGR
jgi:hypothetical protein